MLYDPYSPYSPEEVSIPKFDVEAYWTDPNEPRYGLRPRKAISYNESSRWKFVSDTPLATPVPEPSKELPPSSTENNDQHVHIDDAIEEVVQHFPEVFDPVPAALNPEKVIISETDSDIDSDLDDSIYDGMEEVSASPRIPINRAQSKREDGEEKLDDGEADLNAILNAYGIKTEIRSKIVTECEKVKPFMKAMSRKLEKRLNRKITNECLSTEAENEMTPTLKVVPKPDIPKIRIADMPPPPRSYREAMAGPWKEYWEHADAEELNSHVSKKTYRYSRYPSHGRVLRSHIVRSYKGTVDGYLDRFKSRDVLAGHP
ncbi:hypothetical protein BCR33DRAFT_588995 [Rhizoclosmatium globosum]|uniref:Uncharacterized protein n=1 Tax=Rhizoclosmatium globosum TaxID=329046 RepID=A0A1Y2B2N7_9FUNG|nr:hypothetical protein BCR33DRAFT_588995 [Rhizoclosmatium globosum]|eukprot:ORY29082.1 hypothetical protein BCR33DRAFT_588995 [Rhizoclosmatium globosum]